MDNLLLNPLVSTLTTESNPVASQGTATTTSLNQSPEFRDLLTAMMLSSFISQSSSDSSGSGMGMQQLIAPLMISLLEKMLAGQVETVEPVKIKETKSQPVNAPQGRPVSKGPITQGSHAGHVALDFGVPVGTPVKSTLDGKVTFAGWNNQGYGNLIIVENGPYRVFFAHLSDFSVKVGDKIQAGEVLGKSGNTGDSTGPHLHYEVRKNGVALNPTSFTL